MHINVSDEKCNSHEKDINESEPFTDKDKKGNMEVFNREENGANQTQQVVG